MDLHDFGRVMALEEDGLMAFFQDHGLLRRQLHCTTCSRQYSTIKWKKATVVHYVLRCPSCRTKKKLTTDTMFEGAHLHMRKLLALIYLWAYNICVGTATTMSGASSATVVQWCFGVFRMFWGGFGILGCLCVFCVFGVF